MSKIRPPSPTLNRLRPVSIPKGTKEPVKGLDEAKSYSEAFIACLNALISEMRLNPRYVRSVKLANGELQKDLQNNVYTFVLDDSDLVFEGSRVRARIKGTIYSGLIIRITNLSPKILYLEINKNLGSKIESCELEQDDAALYEVLLDRYFIETGLKEEKSIKKIESDFAFSDSVIQNKPKIVEHQISISQKDLNSDQLAFVKKALDHNISYLWGPPGTGKTQCLGSLITALYDASERSIITSNTNQAVDQVLLKLCRELKANDRMEELEKGRILREGPIQNLELTSEFGEYLDIKSVTKIVGKPLNQELERLEKERSTLTLELKNFPELERKIEQAEYWFQELGALTPKEERAESKYSSAVSDLDDLVNKHDQLVEELSQIGQRGFLKSIFGKSKYKLDTEIFLVEEELVDAKDRVESAKVEYDAIAEQVEEVMKSLNAHMAFTDGMTLAQLKEKKTSSEKKIKTLSSKIKNISKELNELSDKIIGDARVIGVTLTTIFLIPTKIGKFENLIIDEASMAILPMVHFASSMATKRVVISGDFRQIPPILESDNPEIEHWIGNNIFLFSKKNKSPISDIFIDELECSNAHMLKWQYRMPFEICELISNFSYNSLLKTAPTLREVKSEAPKSFEGSIIVLDTNDISPYCDITSSGSRNNTIHALIAERVANKFVKHNENETVGYLSPFRAQSDLVREIFNRSGLARDVAVGTVHTFQGDEKDTIIFDTVDGLGGAKRAGSQISKDDPAEAYLLNVAMSRARQRIIIIANLKLLDQTLPAMAFLRQVLAKAEEMHQVISPSNLLPFQKIETSAKASLLAKEDQVAKLKTEVEASNLEINRRKKELQKLQDSAQKEIELRLDEIKHKEEDLANRNKKVEEAEAKLSDENVLFQNREAELQQELSGLLNENVQLKKELSETALTYIDGSDFTSIFEQDIRRAKRSVLIYSGFATVNRVQKCLPLFKEATSRGVRIRVVVRWEGVRGFYTKESVSAVELLQRADVIVDLRADVHQKAILIDDDISWVGSLNPLSFNERKSSETMWRVEGTTTTLEFGRELALNPYMIKTTSDLVKAENPRCGNCKSVTQYNRFRGKKYVCVSCGAVTPFGRKRK